MKQQFTLAQLLSATTNKLVCEFTNALEVYNFVAKREMANYDFMSDLFVNSLIQKILEQLPFLLDAGNELEMWWQYFEKQPDKTMILVYAKLEELEIRYGKFHSLEIN